MRVAINGFGRIGRLVLRKLIKKTEFQVVAINDLVTAENLAYLLQYDSTHGPAPFAVKAKGDQLIVDGKSIQILSEKDPNKLPWDDLKIDWVIEATGRFTHFDNAAVHLNNGARKVIVTAPGKGEMPTFVMGVNHKQYSPNQHHILSNASCTTNCLAPMTKVLLDHFGIEEGLMTTIHAVTATQPTVDGPSKKDFRAGRGAFQNIIPASTGAATAVAQCLPEVKGKLTGMAFRVPVANVSCVDLTVRLTKPTTYEAISQAMKIAATHDMKGIMQYTDQPVVSTDFLSSPASCIYDSGAGMALNDHFFKLVGWYDNEMGYSARVVDLMEYMKEKA